MEDSIDRTIKISTLEELQRSSAGLQAKLSQAIEHHFSDAESAVKTELVEANEYLFQAGQALDRARDISERAFEFSEALDKFTLLKS